MIPINIKIRYSKIIALFCILLDKYIHIWIKDKKDKRLNPMAQVPPTPEPSCSPGCSHLPIGIGVLAGKSEVQHVSFSTVVRQTTHAEVGL